MLTNDDLKQIQKIVDPLATDLKDVKKRVRKIEKTVDVATRMFNKDDISLARRVTKIEEHLEFPTKN